MYVPFMVLLFVDTILTTYSFAGGDYAAGCVGLAGIVIGIPLIFKYRSAHQRVWEEMQRH